VIKWPWVAFPNRFHTPIGFRRGKSVGDDSPRDLDGAPGPNGRIADIVTLIAPPAFVEHVVNGVCDVILNHVFAVRMLVENVVDPRRAATARSDKKDWKLNIVQVRHGWIELCVLDR
jgi:hypothetical protein